MGAIEKGGLYGLSNMCPVLLASTLPDESNWRVRTTPQTRACHRLIQSTVAARQRTPVKDMAVFS
jgi:hypothetical protein